MEEINVGASPSPDRVEWVDPTQEPDWDRSVLAHPAANVFHSAAWARVLMETYGHRPVYLRCRQGERLTALVPLVQVQSLLRARRGISLPFSDFCEPLLFGPGGGEGIFARLCGAARARRWRYLELRGAGGVPPSAVPAVSFHAHRIDLRDGFAAATGRFRPSVRQALRKIRRDGQLTVRVERSEAALRAFFALHGLTRRRHGLPPQPFAFFRHIQREIIDRAMGFVVLVRRGETPVCGMVFFHWGKMGIYKFGASDKTFQALRPNHLAMSTAIQTLAEAGAETLHFGRSSLLNAGLRRFKLTWGAAESSLHYYRYQLADGAWGTARDRTDGFYNEVFRRLPLEINRLAGEWLYPHLD